VRHITAQRGVAGDRFGHSARSGRAATGESPDLGLFRGQSRTPRRLLLSPFGF
jgi:hypothetical protein